MLTATRPDGWSDKSMVIYAAPLPAPPSGVLPNVVIIREALAADLPAAFPDRIREFARRQLEEMRGKFPEFELLEGGMSRVQDHDAARMRASWRSDQARVVQLSVMIGETQEQAVIATATAAETDFQAYADRFEAVIASIVLDP